MILRSYGSEGGKAFLHALLARTDALCRGLDALGIRYFRDPAMNVVTMRAEQIPARIAEKYMLVPDRHGAPTWWKAVVMDHVHESTLARFLEDLAAR
jgi:glutamate/tyrosine decarboxylase-like PLP-dependent enzyme